MRSAAKRWFTEEAERAGWISAITCVVGACWCLGWVSGGRSSWFVVVYPILPMALGCVAVGALNFRRWHGFQESMEACVAAVVDVYKIIGIVALMGLVFSVPFGRAFLYLVVLLILSSLYLVMIFLVAVLVGCVAGAGLYGLLRLMWYAGQRERSETNSKEAPPRALRMMV